MSLVSKITDLAQAIGAKFNTEKTAREAKEWVILGTNSVNASQDITAFPDGVISIIGITNLTYGYPAGVTCKVVVDRRFPDKSFQNRICYGEFGDIYTQKYRNNVWLDWVRQVDEFDGLTTLQDTPAVEDKQVLIPGEVERQNETRHIAHGLPLQAAHVQDLDELAQRLGVEKL